MKKFTLTLLLSIVFAFGSSGVAYADRHHNDDRGRKEHRDNRYDNRDKGYGDNRHHGKDNREDHSYGKPGHGSWDNRHHNNPGWRPTPPPPPPMHPAPAPCYGPGYVYDIERDPCFLNMIAQAAYGGSDVRVWRINYDTYIVKYRIGHRWYTRKFYPYANRYDNPGMININWNPRSGWTLLPSININIPLD